MMSSTTGRARAAGLTAALVTSLGVGVVGASSAVAVPSTGVMIAEVYGGGGTSGATLTNDFVELGNAGSVAAALTGWSVQYLPAVPSTSTVWQVTPLSGEVAAGGRYLVREAAGSGGTTPLPTADAVGTIPMSATAGTVALVESTTALTCKTAADCAGDSRIRDLVGYGSTAVVRETAPTANLSNTTSGARPALTDTDDNSTDFTVGAPTPTTSTPPPPPPPVASISEIQGTTRLSPLDGQRVSGVTGVVTAVRSFGSARGFWFQDPTPDVDPATSEGLFVFTGASTPGVQPGDAVTVTGTVDEFYPSGTPTTSVHPSTTELVGASWTVESTRNTLPTAEELLPGTVPEDFTPEADGGSIEALLLRPEEFALDFYESREGMLVGITDAGVVGPTTSFNELIVTSKPQQNPTARGGTRYAGYDEQNGGRLLVTSVIPFSQRPFPKVNVGDRLDGLTAGPVDYNAFNGYGILATELGTEVAGGIQRETTRPQRDNELAIATYNVENLDPGDPQDKFDRLAEGVVDSLADPDVLALEEIQDDSGPTNNGVVTAGVTLERFTDAIVAAGGPRYLWRQIDPVNNQDGGEPGGNIRVGFLFNPARVSFVDRPGGDAVTAVAVEAGPNGKPRLSVSPGRIDPLNVAWSSSRKPLVGEFVFNGKTVFVVANHFNSKGGDEPLAGRKQPPSRISEIQRLQQADAVRAFVDDLQAVKADANVVVLGDINDFEFSPVVSRLTAGGALVDLITTLPENERYSYVFQGNSQTLDHILVSGRLKTVDYDVVHINAEFFDQASDHDPQVVRLKPGN
ncbi:endonuclease/exonuclease/phosphatase family protein [Fodinibacter luteus]|uniref:Endonuclease/exonuclease/phosphatase family protein n=1 Tax=Fodinibacter luteus TaxID=552064 RepID=A0ABP8KDD2_9MICO